MTKAISYGLLSMALSLATEAFLLTVVGWQLPTGESLNDGTKVIAVLFTAVPLAAGYLVGFRKPAALLLLMVFTAVITQLLASAIIGLTDMKTGFLEPVITRSLAGFFAAMLVLKIAEHYGHH